MKICRRMSLIWNNISWLDEYCTNNKVYFHIRYKNIKACDSMIKSICLYNIGNHFTMKIPFKLSKIMKLFILLHLSDMWFFRKFRRTMKFVIPQFTYWLEYIIILRYHNVWLDNVYSIRKMGHHWSKHVVLDDFIWRIIKLKS